MKNLLLTLGLVAASSAAQANYETISSQIVKTQTGSREIRLLRNFQYDCVQQGIRTVCLAQEGDIYKLVGIGRMVDPELFTLEHGDVAELTGNVSYTGRESVGDGMHEIKYFTMLAEEVKVVSRGQILLLPEQTKTLKTPALEQSFMLLYMMPHCHFQLSLDSGNGSAVLTTRSDMQELMAKMELFDLSTGERVSVAPSFPNAAYLRAVNFILPDVPRRNRQVLLRSRGEEPISALVNRLSDRVELPVLSAKMVCE